MDEEGRLSLHKAWEAAVKDRMIFSNISDTSTLPADDTVLYVGEQLVLDTLRRKHVGFPQKFSPLPKDQVIVQHTPSMGLGVYAKRNFKPGDTVVRERPFLVAAADITSDPSASGQEINYIIAHKTLEEILLLAGRQFLSANRNAFDSLSKDYTLDPITDTLKDVLTSFYIICCNGFRVNERQFEASGVYKDYRVVPRVASRMNHSCSPNAIYYFDEATFTFNVVATRNIKVDEEIFLTYCPLEVPRAGHRRLLPYNIDPCHCEACSTTDLAGSDKRREMIFDFDWHKVLKRQHREALTELIHVRKAIEDERLHHVAIYPLVLRLTAYFWLELNNTMVSLAEKTVREAEIYYDIHGKSEAEYLRSRITFQ